MVLLALFCGERVVSCEELCQVLQLDVLRCECNCLSLWLWAGHTGFLSLVSSDRGGTAPWGVLNEVPDAKLQIQCVAQKTCLTDGNVIYPPGFQLLICTFSLFSTRTSYLIVHSGFASAHFSNDKFLKSKSLCFSLLQKPRPECVLINKSIIHHMVNELK